MRSLAIKEYRRKKGFRFKKLVDVEIVAAELDKLRDNGELYPETVVKAAQNKKSPLHSYFTWDDTAAARLRRLDEARYLIRSIEVVYDDPIKKAKGQEVEITTRAFQTLHIYGEAQPFRRIEDILDDPELRNELIQKAYKMALRWRNNYMGLTEFAKVFEAIDELEL